MHACELCVPGTVACNRALATFVPFLTRTVNDIGSLGLLNDGGGFGGVVVGGEEGGGGKFYEKQE